MQSDGTGGMLKSVAACGRYGCLGCGGFRAGMVRV